MKKIIIASLILTLFAFAKCRKDKPDNNGLPPATQEGKNTLGFLLNGQPWTPQGNNGTANLSIDYDPSFENGVLGISAYRIISNTNREYFGIGIRDSINFMTTPFFVNLSNNGLYRIRFETNGCTYFSADLNTYVSGILKVNKLDKAARIISGTFNATLFKTDCSDTIRISEGRFDMTY